MANQNPIGKHILARVQQGIDTIELPEVETKVGFDHRSLVTAAVIVTVTVILIFMAKNAFS